MKDGYKSRYYGFHLCFKNGYTISAQFGPGMHGDHYEEFSVLTQDVSPFKFLSSGRAEIAIFDPTGEMVTGKFTDDPEGCIKGYVEIDEFMEIANKVRVYKVYKESEEVKQ